MLDRKASVVRVEKSNRSNRGYKFLFHRIGFRKNFEFRWNRSHETFSFRYCRPFAFKIIRVTSQTPTDAFAYRFTSSISLRVCTYRFRSYFIGNILPVRIQSAKCIKIIFSAVLNRGDPFVLRKCILCQTNPLQSRSVVHVNLSFHWETSERSFPIRYCYAYQEYTHARSRGIECIARRFDEEKPVVFSWRGALCLPPIAFVPADRFPSWYERRLQTGQSKTWPEGIRGFLVSRRRLCRRRRVFRIPVDVGTSVCPRRSPTAEIFDPSSAGSYEPYMYTNLGDIGLCSNVRLYVSLAKMDTYICRRISICTWVYASVVRPSLQCQLRVFTMLAQACFQLN